MSRATGMNIDDAIRRVMTAIAIGDDVVNLSYTAPDGTQPLIVTTPNEYLSDVIARVEAVGGSANVALARARSFSLFVIRGEGERAAHDAESDELNKELSMGMFYLRAQRRGPRGMFSVKRETSADMSGARDFAYAGR